MHFCAAAETFVSCPKRPFESAKNDLFLVAAAEPQSFISCMFLIPIYKLKRASNVRTSKIIMEISSLRAVDFLPHDEKSKQL